MKIDSIVISIEDEDDISMDGDLVMSIETAKRLRERLNELFHKPSFVPLPPNPRDFLIGQRPLFNHRISNSDVGRHSK